MIIGIDLSVLQTPHRMRGIGATAINFINHLPTAAKNKHKFVFYLYEQGQQEALDILDLAGVDYQIRFISKHQRFEFNLPGKLKRLNSVFNGVRGIYFARKSDPRGGNLTGVDSYLQFDQLQPLPKKRGVKKSVILYDLIPYIMEDETYFWTYRGARHHGDSRKSAIRKSLLRRQYIQTIKTVCKGADSLIAISEHTKNDFIKYVGVSEDKIEVVHLGIHSDNSHGRDKKPAINRLVKNSWGYFPQEIDLADKPFLLFVGGADPRRRLIDLIAAYNNLRARGVDIRLVLAGDTMKGPKTIPIPSVQKYLLNSSYLDGVAFLGFVTDDQREWLYENALAFIYPSVYEGFGLPVLEAMQYGTPVITYKNTSIYEIARESALYAKDSLSIKDRVEDLLNDPQLVKELNAKGKKHSAVFSWPRTVDSILEVVNA